VPLSELVSVESRPAMSPVTKLTGSRSLW